jgi:transposase
MIDQDKRNAIYQLYCTGMRLREIARRFQLSRNTVRGIIRNQAAMPNKVRKDKIEVDPELLAKLYRECDGWLQRVHERLVEEEHVQISYPTLTRLARALRLGQPIDARCDRVPDQPGSEMQHDTSPFQVKLAGQRTKLTASLLYLRYSKLRYLKFYRVFTRFVMKCFLHEGLTYWDHAAPWCIIDNTNLARLRGSGRRAILVPEMVAFAEQYGFQFVCHEIGHANRKAGEERSFWTVETNFLAGRTFENLEDLNRQAFEWATVRMAQRVVPKTGLIPARAFEEERPYLRKLTPHLPPPYLAHERDVNQYGYVSFEANYYWVPGRERGSVKVLQYADSLKIYQHRQCVAEYPLAADGVKGQFIGPEGQPAPRHTPRKRRRESREEEQRLRALGEAVGAYLDAAFQTPGIQRHRFVRQLFSLSGQVSPRIFVQALERAHRYRIFQIDTLHRIAWFCLSQSQEQLPEADVDEHFRDRPAYQEGYLTDEPDLSAYDTDGDQDDQDDQPF